MATKQKSGLYRTKVKIGVDADGKDINKWISAKTKRELEEEKRKVIAYYITGTGVAADRMFGEYAVEWYKVRKEPFVSESSRNSYRTMLNKHIIPEFGNRNMRAIKSVEIQKFINKFEGKSKSQITCAMTTMQAIFAAAKLDRLVTVNPAENLRRPNATPPVEKTAFTDAERAKMMEVMATHEHGRYLAVMYYTGARPGEVRGLQWGDFDWEKDFAPGYREQIVYRCLIMSRAYIETRFADIRDYGSVIEQRLDDSGLSKDQLIRENEENLRLCREKGCDYILLDGAYAVDLSQVVPAARDPVG